MVSDVVVVVVVVTAAAVVVVVMVVVVGGEDIGHPLKLQPEQKNDRVSNN